MFSLWSVFASVHRLLGTVSMIGSLFRVLVGAFLREQGRSVITAPSTTLAPAHGHHWRIRGRFAGASEGEGVTLGEA